jgi:hypothetical protein
MRTLSIGAKVEESIVGTAALGPRFPAIQVGRMAPMIRTKEDLLGLLNAGYLDNTIPLEVNLLSAGAVRSALIRSASRLPDEQGMTERGLLYSRPIIAYVPPETVVMPNDKAASALAESGPVGQRISLERIGTPDVEFWSRIADLDLYRPWVYELAALGGRVRASLFAPPVPVIARDQPDSPQAQLEANGAFAQIWTRDPTLRSAGPLYSLHIHPSAFRSPEVLQRALTSLNLALSAGDVPYWGVHLNLTDIGVITMGGGQQVGTATEFVREVVRLAGAAGLFVWISDVGPIGAALMDAGPSFTSYYPGMTPRRIYLEGVRGGPETLFGKVMGGLWNYNLLARSEVENLKWQLEDTGRSPSVVPVSVRNSATPYRQEFAKPYNISVAEKYNEFRERELVVNRQPAPGRAVLGRSKDKAIVPWAVV